jgi:hypothetical protein
MRNTHYQLFLGLDAPTCPFVLVSHNSLIMTTFSSPAPLVPNSSNNNNNSNGTTLARVCTVLVILPRPAYVYEIIIRGAGGCKMSVSLGMLFVVIGCPSNAPYSRKLRRSAYPYFLSPWRLDPLQ